MKINYYVVFFLNQTTDDFFGYIFPLGFSLFYFPPIQTGKTLTFVTTFKCHYLTIPFSIQILHYATIDLNVLITVPDQF